MKKTYRIKGMHCPACKALIEDICNDFDEIDSADVDVKKETLSILANDSLNEASLIAEIESAGNYSIM